ncbi:uncharacterized protein LOC119590332 [Penaeus monodon]|uniref:uncharacterized protein LOC119590332 n=1 Tax=Penaeus monodon TaxID=6687 RepID=UPI0018A73BA0|nr:uncharacterized protein LOC119590332 [Penaeus monodon]
MVRTYKKKMKQYNEVTIAVAINDVIEGSSIKRTAKKYGMSSGMLWKPCPDEKSNTEHKDNRDIVHDYLIANEISTPFKDNRPGRDWVNSFLLRHNMTLKKGGQMQLARKSVTSDPFVIYGFYDMLEKEMDRLNIKDRPECIYNLDETGFPMDPSKSKTIGSKGEKTVRLTHGANRENITVLATCCADGTCLDPLTLAKKTANTRPLLVILDGHLSHTSLTTVEVAIQENISLIKLPPHCTDLLQPLDVACFAPMKSNYDAKLTQYVQTTGAREPLRKSGFVNMLCSIWRQSLSENNIKAGFKATGLMPIDKTKYNNERLDPIKLATYNSWVSKGMPTNENNDPILEEIPEPNNQEEPQIEQPIEPIRTSTPAPTTLTHTDSKAGCSHWTNDQSNSLTSQINQDAENNTLSKFSTAELVDELQRRAPSGMKYTITLELKPTETTLEEVLHARGRSATPVMKRRRVIPMKGQVITNEECLKEIKSKEENKMQTAKQNKKTKQPPKKKNVEVSDTDSTTVSTEEMDDGNTSSDISLSDLLPPMTPEATDEVNEQQENAGTNHDMMPKLSDDSVNKYYAVFLH